MSIAVLFPGQGAQYIGMGKDLYESFENVRSIFDKADQILNEQFLDLVFNGTEEELKRTENTQPGILMVSVAIYELMRSFGIKADMTAGLSLGEYSALVATGSIAYEDALPLVRKRGQFMQQAVPEGKGAMAAVIGLDKEILKSCCKDAQTVGIVGIANYNCPGQLVISGETLAVQKASELAAQAGAKRVILLNVSGPFHSPLLKPAGEALEAELGSVEIKDPVIPVISNVTARPVKAAAEIKDLLVKQVSSPVLWEDSIRYMIDSGVDTFIEMGPGKVLTGFVKKIDKSLKTMNVEDLSTLDTALKELGVK